MQKASIIYTYGGEENIEDETEKWIIIATDNEEHDDIIRLVGSIVEKDHIIHAIHPEYEIIAAYEVEPEVLVALAEEHEIEIEIIYA